jgi:hypothetical protein
VCVCACVCVCGVHCEYASECAYLCVVENTEYEHAKATFL